MKLKYLFFYFLYGFAVLLFFLFILFPKEKAAYLLSEKINKRFADGKVLIKEITPVLPLGLKAVNPALTFGNGTEINIDFISIYPKLLSFHKDVKQAEINAEAYKGKINGTVEIEKKKGDALFNINFSKIDIDNFKHSIENFSIVSSFKMDADINYRTAAHNIAKGSGNGDISITDCILKSDNILLKQMGISQITFTAVDINWNKKETVLNIGIMKADGPDFKIELSGSIALKAPLDKSGLNLSGDFIPSSAQIKSIARLASGAASLISMFSGSKKTKGVPFKIQGTIKEPKVIL